MESATGQLSIESLELWDERFENMLSWNPDVSGLRRVKASLELKFSEGTMSKERLLLDQQFWAILEFAIRQHEEQ